MTTNNSADKAGENPVGSICRYDFTAPTNYLECDGSCVSETTYAKLFDVVGNEYEAAIGAVDLTAIDDATSGGTYGRASSWHPDSNYIAHASNSTNKELSIYSFDGTTLTSVYDVDLDGATQCSSWNINGTYLAIGSYVTSNQLKMFSWNGVSETLSLEDTLSIDGGVNVVEWNHDGTYLAVGNLVDATSKQVTIYSFDGSSFTEEETVDTGCSIYTLAWTSDSGYLAVGKYTDAAYEIEVYSWTVGTKTLASVATATQTSPVYGIAWSASEDYLFTCAANVKAYSFDGSSLTEKDSIATGAFRGMCVVGANLIVGVYDSGGGSTKKIIVYNWNEGTETLSEIDSITENSNGNFNPVVSPNKLYLTSGPYLLSGVTLTTYSTDLSAGCSYPNFQLPTVTDNIIRSK